MKITVDGSLRKGAAVFFWLIKNGSFMRSVLVLQQYCFDEYRAIQSIQDKSWFEANGYSLGERHNVVLDALGCSLRVSQKRVIHVVVLFVKGATIPCKARLVANPFLTHCIDGYRAI
ncbi:MAG: hypothetical protein DSZ29_01925, partial [Aquificaceae bacterium]